MAELKTRKNTANVVDFLNAVEHDTRREDAFTVLRLLQKVTGRQPRMWGSSIVGFDEYHYRYASGHEGDMCMVGFSPRAAALTLYVLPAFDGKETLLRQLGRHKTGKGCLYIGKLADVDLVVLEQIMREAYLWMRQTHRAGD